MSEEGYGFVIDNRSDDDEKVVDCLRKWCNASDRFDIATGYFEIGALRELDGHWQKLDKVRILMGDQTSRSTKSKILEGVQSKLDQSFDAEKDVCHFMEGVPAIVEAMRTGKIEVKVYAKHKFHAKLYLTHAKPEFEVLPSVAIVGSSNFTIPGISKNIELNVRVDPQSQVLELQRWFDEFWEAAEDVSDEILQTMIRHVREYEPFLIYGRALEEYFRGRDATISTWHEDARDNAEGDFNYSQVWWRLDQYQKDGYRNMLKIADTWGGAFLCDGVGLGKTFVGLMLLEKLAGYDRKRVLLISPKSVHDAVWSPELSDKLGHLYGGGMGNIHAIKLTDIINLSDDEVSFIQNYFDAIVIDEGHHFRNRQKSQRYEGLRKLINEGSDRSKQVFFLTATPINNDILDLYRMICLFTNDDNRHFQRIGIHNLKGHFIRMRKDLNRLMRDDEDEDGDVDVQAGLTKEAANDRLRDDALVRALVVQRSRNFVRESMVDADRTIVFPETTAPKVGEYDLEKIYGDLLEEFERAFRSKDPLFKLSIYHPYNHYLGEDSDDHDFAMEKGRLQAITRLIRIGFLKRFESSFRAFVVSCHNLLLKNVAWLGHFATAVDEGARLDKWLEANAEHVRRARDLNSSIEDDEDAEDLLHDLPDHNLTDWAKVGESELYRPGFDIEGIIEDAYSDLDQIVRFITLMEGITPESDDKVQKLVELLQSDEMAIGGKVIIFTEFMTTAEYLKEELDKRIQGMVIDKIDSQTKEDRVKIVRRFSPYYNNSSSSDLEERGEKEIDILISTDVLAEGLNLQDSVRLINYDIHWNPVRLMQRIGRIDRRMDPDIEERIKADRPERAADRGRIAYWNFLPPDQLDQLLGLFGRVSGKYLKIGKVLGIEGGYGLTEEQVYDDLKEFNKQYHGKRSPEEELRLIYQRLCREHPDEQERWSKERMPTRTVSGKHGDGRYVFFCFSIPAPSLEGEDGDVGSWSHEGGESRWFLCDLDTGAILEQTSEMMDINGFIECEPDEERVMNLGRDEMVEALVGVRKHIDKYVMRGLQAPLGVEPRLVCWMGIG